MESKKFTEAKLNLLKAAEIAIESLKKFPPKEYDNDYYKYILNVVSSAYSLSIILNQSTVI
jgi:hypothetical protein